jgi:hypothetical protein
MKNATENTEKGGEEHDGAQAGRRITQFGGERRLNCGSKVWR